MSREPQSYLKSGANKLKILEFSLAGMNLGINVLKVRRIIEYPGNLVESVPDSNEAIVGMFENHGQVIPIVDISIIFGLESRDEQGTYIIITEFFNTVTGFKINRINGIHDLLWEDVLDTDIIMGNLENPYIIGVAKITDKKNVLLVDYEKIIIELSPSNASEGGTEENKTPLDRTYNILIIEDSSTVRNMIYDMFVSNGFNVKAARDGQEGIDMFEASTDIDLVVTDVEMPKKDGLAVLSHIRNTQGRSDMPVIVYSSIGDIGMKERARVLKANGHVTKMDVGELLETVKNVLLNTNK